MSSTTRPTTEGPGNFLLGSCVSLAVHLAILLLGTLLLKGCQQASPGTAGGEVFREVGLFVVDGAKTVAAMSDCCPVQARMNRRSRHRRFRRRQIPMLIRPLTLKMLPVEFLGRFRMWGL